MEPVVGEGFTEKQNVKKVVEKKELASDEGEAKCAAEMWEKSVRVRVDGCRICAAGRDKLQERWKTKQGLCCTEHCEWNGSERENVRNSRFDIPWCEWVNPYQFNSLR